MIYDRERVLTEIVSDLQNEADELKGLQYLGNDNLIVNFDSINMIGPIPITTAGVKFKLTYTFNRPSDAYTRLTFYWDTSVITQYREYRYDDPSTIEDRNKKIAYCELSFDTPAPLNFMVGKVNSTEPGTITLEIV